MQRKEKLDWARSVVNKIMHGHTDTFHGTVTAENEEHTTVTLSGDTTLVFPKCYHLAVGDIVEVKVTSKL